MGELKSNGHRRGESGGRNRRGQKGCRVFMGVEKFATRNGGRCKNSGHFCFFKKEREREREGVEEDLSLYHPIHPTKQKDELS